MSAQRSEAKPSVSPLQISKDSVKDTRNNIKPKNYIPLGILISNVLIESGLMDHLISLNLMEDVTMDMRKLLNTKNLKSMGLIDKVKVNPTKNTS